MADDAGALRKRFDDLVIWYLNGSIRAEDQAWMEQYMQTHPEARHALDWHRQLQQAMGRSMLTIPADVGLDALMQGARASGRPTSPSWLLRFRTFLEQMAPRPMLAGAAVLIVAQAVGLGLLVKEVGEQRTTLEGYSRIRAVDSGNAAGRPHIRVVFKDSATEKEMRMLLIAIRGQISEGPDQFGGYRVLVPDGEWDAAVETLRAHALVDLAVVKRTSGGTP